jgi:TPR repeat protein
MTLPMVTGHWLLCATVFFMLTATASSPSLAQSQSGREEAVVPPSFPRIAQKQADQEQPVAGTSLPTFAKRQLDREEITVFLKIGKHLIASGDIAAARLTLKRAADAGDAEAALALASTYDPYVLRELKVYGFPADAAMARAWYEKAKDLGSAVAPRRLEMLARGAR